MAARNLFGRLGDKGLGEALGKDDELREEAPLGGTRSEAIQRLQVGVTGLCAMVLVIGIASVIGSQADNAEKAAVPDAAPTTEPTAAPSQRNPLADAGVVPDIPPPADAAPQDAAPKPIVPDVDGEGRVPDTRPAREKKDRDNGS